MSHSHPPPIRWGLFLPVAVVALALYLRPDLEHKARSFLSSSSTQLGQETYCYQGIKAPPSSDAGVTCFTVKDGKFTDVFAPDDGHEVDVLGGYAYPGLWDGHGHLLQYGEFLHSVDLFRSESFDEVRRRLEGYLDRHPGVGGKDEWIRGIGWDQMALGGMPTAVCLLLVWSGFVG
jgi:hypothetical protein